MYSFNKEIKFLDEQEEEKIRNYEFFSFTQNVTSPNINKYDTYGEVFKYSMSRYNDDFLGLNVSNSNLFYIEYVGSFSENYELYDGSFLMYKNMNNPFYDPDNNDESVKREMPISPREEEKVEIKSITYQTQRTYFTTLYYFPGSVSGLNNLRASLTLPKELQIKEFLRPKEITQEDFNTLISELSEEKSMEDLQDELYKIVDDDGVVLEFRFLSYTKSNLINKIVDYNSAVRSVVTFPTSKNSVRENFNYWLDYTSGNKLRVLNFTDSSITDIWSTTNNSFYFGSRYNSSSYRNKTLQYTYDGYNTLRSFYYVNYSYVDTPWNGGILQDYRTNSEIFSSVSSAPEISINNTKDRIFLINSYSNTNV